MYIHTYIRMHIHYVQMYAYSKIRFTYTEKRTDIYVRVYMHTYTSEIMEFCACILTYINTYVCMYERMCYIMSL